MYAYQQQARRLAFGPVARNTPGIMRKPRILETRLQYKSHSLRNTKNAKEGASRRLTLCLYNPHPHEKQKTETRPRHKNQSHATRVRFKPIYKSPSSKRGRFNSRARVSYTSALLPTRLNAHGERYIEIKQSSSFSTALSLRPCPLPPPNRKADTQKEKTAIRTNQKGTPVI